MPGLILLIVIQAKRNLKNVSWLFWILCVVTSRIILKLWVTSSPDLAVYLSWVSPVMLLNIFIMGFHVMVTRKLPLMEQNCKSMECNKKGHYCVCFRDDFINFCRAAVLQNFSGWLCLTLDKTIWISRFCKSYKTYLIKTRRTVCVNKFDSNNQCLQN